MKQAKQSEIRRQELLDIGWELFVEKGADAVSVNEVVGKAQVATGLFYYYFKSKEAFFKEVLSQYITSQHQKFTDFMEEESLPLMERLALVFNDFMIHMGRISLLIRDDAMNSPQYHIILDTMLEKLSISLQGLISEGVSTGIFSVSNPEITARFIIYGLSGILHMGNEKESINNQQAEIKRLAFSALGLV